MRTSRSRGRALTGELTTQQAAVIGLVLRRGVAAAKLQTKRNTPIGKRVPGKTGFRPVSFRGHSLNDKKVIL